VLVARASEQRRIDLLVGGARDGMSGALVLVGEPGIGKTALLDYAAAAATGFRVLRARGVQSEAELAFAALLEVCRPIWSAVDRLEPPQAKALTGALGLSDAEGVTRFMIGAATLALLAAAAEECPLLLLVDDAHWLDRASADALAFAIRRLHVDSVAAVFAMRPGEGRPFSRRQLPELELEPLDIKSSAALLADRRADLDPGERTALLGLAQGNPLALLELPREAAKDQADPVRVGTQLERAFCARAETLPEPSRRALVVAAAASTGEIGVMAEALERLGLSLAALEPAEANGLLTLEAGILAFRHPLIRSALYQAAGASERRDAHRALAGALEGEDRGAWHLAAAVVGPDADAAAALERVAVTATRRAGYAAAAAAYERAARLSESTDDRLRRLSAAADAAWLAGRTAHALALVEEAVALTPHDGRRGVLLHLRGTIEHFGGNSIGAATTLEHAAALLSQTNPHLACLSLIEATGSLLAAGEIGKAVALSERLLQIADPTQPDEHLLTSLGRGSALVMDGRPEEGMPFLHRAAATIREQKLLADQPRNLTWAAMSAYWLGDLPAMVSYAATAARWAREHAAVATLTFAARLLGRAQLITGHWSAARAALEESLDAARLADLMNQQVQSLALLAWLDAAQGHEDDSRRRIGEATTIADSLNLVWRNDLLRALLLLELGNGFVEESPVSRLLASLGNPLLLRDTPASATAPELVEALIRTGDTDGAAALLETFAAEAERIGQPYPQAVALRCQGLLAGEDAFEKQFLRALELHALDSNTFATARTRLAYGERLRRSGRRVDSREQLKQAIDVFDRLDAAPWSTRARNELRATGERVRHRNHASHEELTPQERQVAVHAAEGKTNREIGSQLFLSPKTIEWHLSHVYRKLGITSRGKLSRALHDDSHGGPSSTS
jgi:DNA-binding CsgD family transcriptional regulator/tetratricopeptide (TPR) repeat protein